VKPAIDTRREFLRPCLLASGAWLTSSKHLDHLLNQGLADTATPGGAFREGRLLGLLDFTGESQAPLDTLVGTELDRRLFTDLSKSPAAEGHNANGEFYVRTASELLPKKTTYRLATSAILLTILGRSGLTPGRPGLRGSI